jgi:glycosyltransferase involved in cell wall biosynthesis
LNLIARPDGIAQSPKLDSSLIVQTDLNTIWPNVSVKGRTVSEPMLTIGLPVYNGGSLLARAIDSLLGQSYTGFSLHISDNASTDETERICREAAARDRRIVYNRQSHNIGAVANFRYLLQNARTRYFMWAAHDDRWHPEFVAKNIALLEADPLAIASISQVAFVRDGEVIGLDSTYSLQGTVKNNLHRFWQKPTDCSRFYAIHKTQSLSNSMPNIPPFHAFDWLVVSLTLQHGHYLEVPEVLMWRSAPEPNRYFRQVARDNRGCFLFRLFPLLPITYYSISTLGVRNLPIRDIILLNFYYHKGYVMFVTREHPILFHSLRQIYRGLRWIYWKSGLKKVIGAREAPSES